jgi:uncharacterized membrane protein
MARLFEGEKREREREREREFRVRVYMHGSLYYNHITNNLTPLVGVLLSYYVLII